jgi:hypothetical protein
MFQFCFVELYAAHLKQILTQKFVSKPLQNISWMMFADVEFVSIAISQVTEVKILRMNGNLYQPSPHTCFPGVRRDSLTFIFILSRVIYKNF